MKLSVIVPVYNVELYLKRCLDSILGQTYQNLEIILIDDGSTDRSKQICDEYALTDERITVVHKEHSGVTETRKAGILCATGEYATAVDSDDWIEIGAYEIMVQRLEKYHPDVLVMGYKKEYAGFTEEFKGIFGEGLYQKKDFWEKFNYCVESTDFFCQPIDMVLWNKAIKTEMWRKYQLMCASSLRKNEDDAVIFPCLLDMNEIYIEPKCFYHYCVRNNSTMWGSKYEDYELFIKLSEGLIGAYCNNLNPKYMNKKFLLYKLFYHMILDIPEKLVNQKWCGIYPQINTKSRVIIYGKGVFANRLIDQINRLQFCNIVDNVDSMDSEKIRDLDKEGYDFIVIAILNYVMVEKAINTLLKAGVEEDKILRIEKEKLTIDLLPDEVRKMWTDKVI